MIKWGVILIFLLLPFFNGGKGEGSSVIAEIAIFSLVFFALIREKKEWIKTPFNLPFLIFLFPLIGSTVFSIYLNGSLIGFYRIVGYILLFWLLVNFLRQKDYERIFVVIFFVCCLLIILTFLQQHKYRESYWMLKTSQLHYLSTSYLVTGIIGGLVIFLEKIKSKQWRVSLLTLFFISCCLVVIFLTRSRGAWLSLLVVAVVFVYLQWRWRGLFGLVVGGLLLFNLCPQKLIMQTLRIGQPDPYLYFRLKIWLTSLQAFLKHPLLGTGLNTFGLVYHRYSYPAVGALAQYGKYTRFCHNEFLQIACETGIFGLAVWMWIVIRFLKSALRGCHCEESRQGGTTKQSQDCHALRARNDHRFHFSPSVKGIISERALTTIALLGGVALITQSLVTLNFHLPAITILLILFMASAVSPSRGGERVQPIQIKWRSRVYSALRIIGIVVIILLIVGDLFLGIGHLYARRGEWQLASRFNPYNSSYYEELKNFYLEQYHKTKQEEDKNRVVELYKKMLKVNSEEAFYHWDFGRFWYEIGDVSKAIEEYEEAIHFNPHNPFFWLELGKIQFSQGEYGLAIESFGEAKGVEPCYLEAYYWLGRAWEELGNSEEAKAVYKMVLYIRALIPQLPAPISGYERRLVKFDKEGELYNRLAGIFYQEGEYKRAQEFLKKAVEINPNNQVYRQNLKLLLEK